MKVCKVCGSSEVTTHTMRGKQYQRDLCRAHWNEKCAAIQRRIYQERRRQRFEQRLKELA